MKTTCLFAAALSGLAMAQDPAPAVPPMPQPVPAAPGDVAGVIVATAEASELGEPIKWSLHQGSQDVARSGPVGFLGVNATVAPHELSIHLPLPEDTGLLVGFVAKDSPAEKAGLQASDVLAKFDDQILIDPRQLSVLVANKKEGDTVKLSYIRKGKSQESNVVIGKRDGMAATAGNVQGSIVLKRGDGTPLSTFVRRFEIPGGSGGELRVEACDAAGTPPSEPGKGSITITPASGEPVKGGISVNPAPGEPGKGSITITPSFGAPPAPAPPNKDEKK